MSARLERALAAVLARRRAWIALWALAAALLAPGALRLESDNSPEVFFLADAPGVARYHEFVERFGREEGARLAVAGAGLWTAAGVAYLERAEREIAALPGVRAVVGPAGRLRRTTPDLAAAEPRALRERLAGSALDRALGLVAEQGELASLLVQTEAMPPAEARVLFAALDRLAAEAPAGCAAFAVGRRSIEIALDDSAREIDRLYFPLLVLLAALLLAVTFREASAVVLPFAFVALPQVALLGAMGWLGVRVNLILAVLPPLLFVIALATALHLLIRCRALESEGLDAAAATLATYREKGRAVAAAALTTAIGFAALASSRVAPVRTLGLWAGAGLLVVLAAAFTLLPALLATFAARRGALPERALEARLERFGRRWAARAAARPGRVVALYALVAALALAGLPRLSLESNALSYLPADHPVRAKTARLERAGVGVATVEVWIEAAAGAPGLDDGEALERLAGLAAAIGARAPALAAVSAAELADGIAAGTPFAALPAVTRRPGILALARADPEGARAVARFLEPDGRSTRLTVFVATVGYPALEPWLTEARAEAERRFPGARVATTGSFPLLLELQRHLLTTVGAALALTVPAMLVTFVLLLRRARWVARALAATLFPVAAIFGGMGWLGAPLDVATVMVASIVLGLVVDNTIHTLAPYRERRAALGAREAVVGKVALAAPAYLLTGAILAAGFGVCALSDFRPTARFGVLSSSAIALAVVGDLLLVPALFCGWRARPSEGDAGAERIEIG